MSSVVKSVSYPPKVWPLIDKKPDLETAEILSNIDNVESRITPRLCTERAGSMTKLDGMRREGLRF